MAGGSLRPIAAPRALARPREPTWSNEPILASERYAAKHNALNGIDAVKACAPSDGNDQRKTANEGSPYFLPQANNGQVIGKSEMYSSETAGEKGIESFKKNAPKSSVRDSMGGRSTGDRRRPGEARGSSEARASGLPKSV